MLVVAPGFEWPEEIHMDSLIGLCWDWQRGQGGQLGNTFLSSLAAGTLLDVPGDVKFHGHPPPRSRDLFLCSFYGTVPCQVAAVGLLQDVWA